MTREKKIMIIIKKKKKLNKSNATQTTSQKN